MLLVSRGLLWVVLIYVCMCAGRPAGTGERAPLASDPVLAVAGAGDVWGVVDDPFFATAGSDKPDNRDMRARLSPGGVGACPGPATWVRDVDAELRWLVAPLQFSGDLSDSYGEYLVVFGGLIISYTCGGV